MEQFKRLSAPIRFGIFEVDLQAGELRRQGFKVRLQEQPFQVLIMLLERPGEVVAREDLQKKLWPSDTFVDFERGLNRAINKLREALVDNADTPRFIETLPRRGYRFLAPVEAAGLREPEASARSQLAIVPSDRPRQVESAAPTIAVPTRQVLPWAIAVVLALAVGLAFWRPLRTPAAAADRPFQQLDLDTGSGGFSQPAISSDGLRIVFVSQSGLVLRRLDQANLTRLAGTEGASLPFFSPNGRWVAFFAARKLQKVSVEGGGPIALCDATDAAGGTWLDDETIVATLSMSQGLSRVPAAGGTPQILNDARADVTGRPVWPQALPGGQGILFASADGSEKGSLRVLGPHGVKTLVENSTYGRYLAGGYLIYHQQGTLFAAPMDPGRAELKGPPVPLIDGVSYSGTRANFDLSATGILVYRGGTAGTLTTLAWLYSSGKVEPLLPKPGNYLTPRLSPDGTRLALAVIQGGKQNLWVYDLKRETWTRLTSYAAPDLLPTWTPDGEFLAFRSGNTLAWMRSDGGGKLERLAGVSRNAGPWSFSPDGKWLAFWPLEHGSDLWTAAVERTPGSLQLAQPHPLLQQPGSKGAPSISPDGRWLAYTSDESGRFEAYVIPFSPEASPHGVARHGKWQVSNSGGFGPVFSRNGQELFFQSSDRRVHLAGYRVVGDSFVAEKPRAWSETRLGDTGLFQAFDVAPDGKRVLAQLPAEDSGSQTPLRVLLNVDSELRRRTVSGRGPQPAK